MTSGAGAERREIALMFSGGLDSTVAACRLVEDAGYDRVHLLTYSNGYGHYGFGRVARRVRELADRYPGRFTHLQAEIGDLFRALAVRTAVEDAKRFRSGFVWCLGCKLSMHARSLLHCLVEGIDSMCDGSAADTGEMVEQSIVSLSFIRYLYEDFGIGFTTPVYAIDRSDKREWLRERGFHLGLKVGQRHIGIQPTCRPGEAYYLPYLLFNKPPHHDEAAIARYIDSRRPAIERWLASELKRRGLDLESFRGRPLPETEPGEES